VTVREGCIHGNSTRTAVPVFTTAGGWAFVKLTTKCTSDCDKLACRYNLRQEATTMAGEKWEVVRRWMTTIATTLVVLLVVYVLSVGPAAGWIAWRQRSEAGLSDERIESLESFYLPLIFIYVHCPPIRNPLDWYVDLWE
jgi:hypothetical protein